MENPNRTAGDEARDIQKAKEPMVTVTCALPQGIVMNNHLDKDGKATSTANIGPGGPVQIKGSTDVPKAFWEAWKLNNADMVASGVVSAIDKREQVKNDGEEVGREGSGGPQPDL